MPHIRLADSGASTYCINSRMVSNLLEQATFEGFAYARPPTMPNANASSQPNEVHAAYRCRQCPWQRQRR